VFSGVHLGCPEGPRGLLAPHPDQPKGSASDAGLPSWPPRRRHGVFREDRAGGGRAVSLAMRTMLLAAIITLILVGCGTAPRLAFRDDAKLPYPPKEHAWRMLHPTAPGL
jgi:hypothetical protein